MSYRTDSDKVEAIIEVETGVTLTPFIAAANTLVTECCGEAGYDDDRLEQIETWLAAHFYTIRDPRLATEGAGGISFSVEGRTDMGFKSSKYGQMAMRLDTEGGLAALDQQAQAGKPRAGIFWLGTEPTTLTSGED